MVYQDPDHDSDDAAVDDGGPVAWRRAQYYVGGTVRRSLSLAFMALKRALESLVRINGTPAASGYENAVVEMLPTNTLLASMQRRPAPVTFANASDAALRVPPQTSGVFASNVARCSLTMDEKVTQVTVTASKEIDIAFVSVISSLELVRCRGVRVAFTGTCRTIVVDACDDVELTVPTQSPVRVVSSASTRLLVKNNATAYSVPDLGLQTVTTWTGSAFESQPLDRT